MTLYAREGDAGPVHSVQGFVTNILSPLKIVGTAASTPLDSASTAAGDAMASEETLSALRERNAELTELVAESEEYRQEAERLESLLGLKETYNIDGIAAHVIGRTTDAWNQTVTIDVGSDAGVDEGLTVMGPTGVIGQVISTSPGYSTVRLLTDPNSGAAALVQSSRAEGIVRGSLSGLLYLENIDADVTLNVGDVVLTSGLGGSYTSGLLIGTIARIEGSSSNGMQSVIVSPNEEATSFEDVIVVFSAASDSADAASGAAAADDSDSADDESSSDVGTASVAASDDAYNDVSDYGESDYDDESDYGESDYDESDYDYDYDDYDYDDEEGDY